MSDKKTFDTLIVYCHPYELSFNHAVLTAVEEGLDRAGRSFEVADLYADGFNPAISAPELALYNEGGHTDPLVARYQDQLACCQNLVFVSPIWWNDVPAMLRGWFDKVMLVGFSWDATGQGLLGTLGRFVRRADVFTTSAESTEHLRAALTSSFVDGTLAQLGIAERSWHNFGGMDQSTVEGREAWLAQVSDLMAGGSADGEQA